MINEASSTSGRKSEKSHYSPEQWTQPQLLESSRGQQEVCQLTMENEINDRKQTLTNRRGRDEGKLNSGTEVMPGIQRRSDHSQQSSPQGILEVSRVHHGQPTGEEYDPFNMVTSFHRSQRELITQSTIPSTPSLETGG